MIKCNAYKFLSKIKSLNVDYQSISLSIKRVLHRMEKGTSASKDVGPRKGIDCDISKDVGSRRVGRL